MAVRAGVRRTAAVAANTFREAIRERILYNLVVFALVMTLAGLLLGQLSIRQDEKIVKDIGFAAMELFGTLIAVFLGVSLVSKEIERRSLYSLLAKPLSRTEFFLGKFAGLAATLLVNCAAMTVGLLLTLWITGKAVSLGLLAAVYPIYLGLLVAVALAMMLASVTSSGLATVGVVGLLVAGRYTDVLKNLPGILPGASARVLEVAYLLLPNIRNFDFKDRVAYGDAVPAVQLAWVTAYAVAYATLALGIGLHFFRRRDLP
jgi:ABC-type transport system involved in multi-copper enzyme maturation permease subunit